MVPITRGEIYMATAAGEYSGELPEPVTRQERYWKKIAQRIDEGSSVSPEAIDAAIEDYLNTHDADVVTEAELSDALLGKADASHTHALSEVTGLETALLGKANASHTHAQSDVTGLETALLGKAAASHTHDDRYYTETEIDTVLSGKSNTGHTHDDRYYTEAEVDTLLSGKADGADIPDVSSFITKTVNDLTYYYTKSETYTQSEIDNMVSAIPKFAIEVVQALPSQDISPTTVYLLTVQSGQQGNMYEEYIHVGNSWELLGTQTVDLSGYYTSAQVDALLNGLPVAGHTHDDRYYTEAEIDGKIQTINTAISGKAASDHTHDDRYYTETEIDNKLGGKSNTGHSHTMTDVTGLEAALSGKADATATQTALAGKQNALTAGANIIIETVNDALTISATDTTYSDATQQTHGLMSTADKTKLDGIAAGAEVNVQSDWNQSDTTADDFIKNKPTNATASAAGLMSAADKAKIDGLGTAASANKGAANGVASLDGNGKVPLSQLPSRRKLLNSNSVNLITSTNRELDLGDDVANYEAIEIRFLQYSNGSTNYYTTLRAANSSGSYGVIPAIRYIHNTATGVLNICICQLSLSGTKLTLVNDGGMPSGNSFYVSTVLGYK